MDSNAELGQPVQIPSESKLSIVSPKESDSLGTAEWRNYLDKDKLFEVWSPPDESPYSRFQKSKTIASVDQWATELKPRYSEGERTSEAGIDNLIGSGVLSKNTAVILDSGGPHSVAMAVKLAVEQGYSPVVMFNADVHPQGTNKAEQELATLLYFAEQVKKLKAEEKIKPDAPPVFVLDMHRSDLVMGKDVDNTYIYSQQDFPTAQELRQRGITKVVYLNEGDQEGRITASYQSIDRVNQDLKPVVGAWDQGGLEMVYTGISPWKNERRSFEIPSIGLEDRFTQRGSDLFEREPHYFERRLSYPDMIPEVYGEANGIAMHRNRERFVFTSDGKLEIYNERGFARDMKAEEIRNFRT
ncbi:hypothetical protein A3F02_01430 [Candidatus Curtissbacteria bacterium RIFCSPHIGHO2_12_FULL_38_9b]|uniref:Uncharacterized protein n=2 Tax=Candidatus Curtissiibacteriota TaxID=1752717 RepID=A0A1F5GVF8_9BACT|nr:MAG: hypothetical protein A3F02_01430 [Candidatus Curtissbacteria bacterium RIFCSPHIGHO2_12_FULL_38_9b]OGD95756.1 MAG: hypothetical protein A3A48_03255 [Candidatus Curtissbacteria bacterium RIFCSPLOWO2_01_FULL_37_9]